MYLVYGYLFSDNSHKDTKVYCVTIGNKKGAPVEAPINI